MSEIHSGWIQSVLGFGEPEMSQWLNYVMESETD
jgi:hypothetical protein